MSHSASTHRAPATCCLVQSEGHSHSPCLAEPTVCCRVARSWWGPRRAPLPARGLGGLSRERGISLSFGGCIRIWPSEKQARTSPGVAEPPGRGGGCSHVMESTGQRPAARQKALRQVSSLPSLSSLVYKMRIKMLSPHEIMAMERARRMLIFPI